MERQERMLSKLADAHEQAEAACRFISVQELRDMRAKCTHDWRSYADYDQCEICGEARA